MLTPILFSGTFKLTLQFNEEYPNKPPTVRFVSRMFHPNSKLFLIHIYMSVQEISGSDFVFADLFFPPRVMDKSGCCGLCGAAGCCLPQGQHLNI